MKRGPALVLAGVAVVLVVGVWGAWPLLREPPRSPSQRSSQVTTSTPPQAPASPPDLSGLPNFHRVSDDLYRGGQPTRGGFAALEKMGIKTVVNLRWTRTDRGTVENLGLVYEHFGIKGWHATMGDAVRFLEVVTDKTGFVCAAYRVVVCGWSKDKALREMQDSRFGSHVVFKALPDRIKGMDVEAIRRSVGLAK